LKCKVCDREKTEKNFCSLHLEAYENIARNYDVWRKALNVSWREYLSEIEQNPLTGEWVKEVTNYLINCEEKRNVEKI
jgi:hypothetical protein